MFLKNQAFQRVFEISKAMNKTAPLKEHDVTSPVDKGIF